MPGEPMTMPGGSTAMPGRIRRLAEELAEIGVSFGSGGAPDLLLLTELDYALRPAVHERRAPSFGSIVRPTVPVDDWAEPTGLTIISRPIDKMPIAAARRFADGLSSWLIRGDDPAELAVFDRSAGSERDLVVLVAATGGTLVQRHPSGMVRAVGSFGVLRWDGIGWHAEPPVADWIHAICARGFGEKDIITRLLEFAVHDLGSRGIGAILVYQPDDDPGAAIEARLAIPPPLRIDRPHDLAPFRHVLAQIDGAAVIDASGTLRQLGVRLVPSPLAEADVEGLRGMRHTAGRRYSFDDPSATVIVVSEDGPVTVLRNGLVLGRSKPAHLAMASD